MGVIKKVIKGEKKKGGGGGGGGTRGVMGTRDVTAAAARFNVPSKSVTWESGRRRRRCPVASLFGKVEGGGFGGGVGWGGVGCRGWGWGAGCAASLFMSALHKQHGGSGFSPSVFVNPGLVLLQEQRRSEDYVNWKKREGEGWGEWEGCWREGGGGLS